MATAGLLGLWLQPLAKSNPGICRVFSKIYSKIYCLQKREPIMEFTLLCYFLLLTAVKHNPILPQKYWSQGYSMCYGRSYSLQAGWCLVQCSDTAVNRTPLDSEDRTRQSDVVPRNHYLTLPWSLAPCPLGMDSIAVGGVESAGELIYRPNLSLLRKNLASKLLY